MLPKNDVPIYTITLSSGLNVKFRPYLVKEEKLMLMAAQSRDEVEIKTTVNQIITNCVLEPQGFNPDDQAVFDIEWLLINLRIRSVGSKIETEYTCNNVVNEEPCGEPFTISINLEDVEIKGTKKPENKVFLGENFGVIMRPPRFGIVKEINASDPYDLTILSDAVVSVFDAKQQYLLRDQTPEEIKEWFDGLTGDQFKKIKDYLEKLPIYTVNKKHTCTKCGFNHEIKVDNLTSFF